MGVNLYILLDVLVRTVPLETTVFVHLPRFSLGQTTDSIPSLTKAKPHLQQPKAKVLPRFFSVDLLRG